MNREKDQKLGWEPYSWKDTPIPLRCAGCPYPRTGYICHDRTGDTCLRTDMETITARRCSSKVNL